MFLDPFKVSDAFERYIIRVAGAWYSDPIGLNSYQELVAWKNAYGIEQAMPVYRPTDEDVANSIFNSAEGFQAFQAWHDRRHLIYQQNFTLKGEHTLAQQHLDELLREGVDAIDAVAVYNLIYGRNYFYHNNARQQALKVSEFVRDALNCGPERAGRDRGGINPYV